MLIIVQAQGSCKIIEQTKWSCKTHIVIKVQTQGSCKIIVQTQWSCKTHILIIVQAQFRKFKVLIKGPFVSTDGRTDARTGSHSDYSADPRIEQFYSYIPFMN